MCDGILMPGGLKTYEYDYYICKYAKENNIPLFGICAGMKVMARIDKNVETLKIINDKHKTNIDGYSHSVILNKDSKIYDIIGKQDIKVNSYHTYYISNVKKNYISGISDDWIVEAIEDKNNYFYLGVQWHPGKLLESDYVSQKLFSSFIDASEKYNKVKIK